MKQHTLAAARTAALAVALATVPVTAMAEALPAAMANRGSIALTIYGDGLALIRESRQATVASGRNRVSFPGVSRQIVASSAVLGGGPGIAVVAVDYDFDLVTRDALLRRSLGKTVTIIRTHPQTGGESAETATVLSVDGGLVLDVGGRIETDPPGRIAFPALPAGLIAQPSLTATLDASAAGARDLTLTYLTNGLVWSADYVALLDDEKLRLDLEGRATVTNTSGVDYVDAALGLIAGRINRQETRVVRPMAMARSAEAMAAPAAAPPPERETLADLHLYRVPGPVSLADQQTRQLTLLRAPGLEIERRYVSEAAVPLYPLRAGEPQAAHPQVRLRFAAPAGDAAQPLPEGIARVYVRDPRGELRLVGEDRLPATPAGGTVTLRPGEAFDLRVLRRQTDYTVTQRGGTPQQQRQVVETAWSVVVSSAKSESVPVTLVESIPGDWQILAESAPHSKETAERVVWTLTVPAKGSAELTYRVRLER